MKTPTTLSQALFSMALLATTVGSAAAATSVHHFSDPTKPGRLVVQAGFGDVTIVGQDTQDVTISSDNVVQSAAPPRDDGFRRLDGGAGFSATESDNVMSVTFGNVFPGKHGRRGHDADVRITVPRQTSVTIECAGPGDMEVHDLSGDLEIRGAIGDIELAGLGGGVLVESVNGDIAATFAALVANKSVSITVVHGDVSLTVPADARADVQLRTLQGEMLTNFSETEFTARFNNNDGADVLESADAGSDEERDRAKSARDRANAERDRVQAERDRARAQQNLPTTVHAGHPPLPPLPPTPPLPPMPPMAGGKLVAGTLNGGGTALTVATITGDITLKKAP